MNLIKKKTSFVLACLLCFVLGSVFGKKILEDALTFEVVNEAQKVMGLAFSRAEIDSLLDGLESQREDFLANRKIELDNSVSPAIMFNPLLSGKKFGKKEAYFRLAEKDRAKLPSNREELAFYSVRELSELLKNGQVSSEELTRFFLDRLKKFDAQLFCVIQLTEELALKQARQADQEMQAGKYRGPLHGIPYGVKDLLATKDYKTTWGAAPYKEQYIDQDAAVVKKMREAGAVLVAKLTLGALAMGDVWYGGKTRNPWNFEQGSSGSSAGSASAVAAGLLPFAIGTETLGSIVSPSTRCGTTGLRPTFGRVSRSNAMALSWTMDKIGPICRSVEDCALVFRYLHGPDGEDLRVVDVPFHYDGQEDVKKLKIAYVKEAFAGDYRFKQQDQAVLDKFREMGHELIPITLPPLPDIGFILTVEAAAAFDQLTLTNRDDQLVRQYKNAWPNLFRQARFVPAVEYVQANRLRTLLMQQMEKVMTEVDVFISPSFRGNTLRITNLTGHPCVVLPHGFSPNKTPTSITFIGQLFEEGKLLRVAQAFQENTDFHLKHPNLKP